MSVSRRTRVRGLESVSFVRIISVIGVTPVAIRTVDVNKLPTDGRDRQLTAIQVSFLPRPNTTICVVTLSRINPHPDCAPPETRRDTDTQRHRYTDTGTDTKRERERERERERQRQTVTRTQTHRERERESERDTHTERHTTEREREREQRERERHTDRHTHTQTDTHTQTHRHTGTDTHTHLTLNHWPPPPPNSNPACTHAPSSFHVTPDVALCVGGRNECVSGQDTAFYNKRRVCPVSYGRA